MINFVTMSKEIVLLSDNSHLSKAFKIYAVNNDMNIILCSNLKQVEDILKKSQCDAVAATIPLTSESCPKRIIQAIHKVNTYIPVFILIDRLDVSLAITLTKHGAENCYSRPFLPDVILENIKKTISETSAPNLYSQSAKPKAPKYLEARSKAAQNLYQQIDTVKDTNFKVIVYGETGTGK